MITARLREGPHTLSLIGLCLALTLAACGGRRTPSDEALAVLALTTKAGIVDYAVDPDQLKRAAAEYFVAVAEAAPGADGAALHKLVGEADYAESAVHRSLSIRARHDIVGHQATLNAALKSSARAQVALSASEAFRVLIDDTVTADSVPTGVMQLEYARLRAQANLDAKPTRWVDIGAGQAGARLAWEGLSPDVSDAELKGQIAATARELDEAVTRKDVAAARAVTVEQRHQVERLKAYFKRPH